MPHVCMDEVLAFLALFPVIGYLFRKLHMWYHTRFHHKCHEKTCSNTHVEHCHMPSNIPHGKVGEGQCEQHPLPPTGFDQQMQSDTFKQAYEEARLQVAREKWSDYFPARIKVMQNTLDLSPAVDQPTPMTWDPISAEDVEERFPNLPNLLFNEAADFFINEQGHLKMFRHAKVFVYDPQNGWSEE